jgi:hypothetical protein
VDQKKSIQSMIQINPNWKKPVFMVRIKNRIKPIENEVVWFGSRFQISDPMDKPNQTNI